MANLNEIKSKLLGSSIDHLINSSDPFSQTPFSLADLFSSENKLLNDHFTKKKYYYWLQKPKMSSKYRFINVPPSKKRKKNYYDQVPVTPNH